MNCNPQVLAPSQVDCQPHLRTLGDMVSGLAIVFSLTILINAVNLQPGKPKAAEMA